MKNNDPILQNSDTELWFGQELLVSFSSSSKGLSLSLSTLIELTSCSNKVGPFNHDWQNFNLLNGTKRQQDFEKLVHNAIIQGSSANRFNLACS